MSGDRQIVFSPMVTEEDRFNGQPCLRLGLEQFPLDCRSPIESSTKAGSPFFVLYHLSIGSRRFECVQFRASGSLAPPPVTKSSFAVPRMTR